LVFFPPPVCPFLSFAAPSACDFAADPVLFFSPSGFELLQRLFFPFSFFLFFCFPSLLRLGLPRLEFSSDGFFYPVKSLLSLTFPGSTTLRLTPILSFFPLVLPPLLLPPPFGQRSPYPQCVFFSLHQRTPFHKRTPLGRTFPPAPFLTSSGQPSPCPRPNRSSPHSHVLLWQSHFSPPLQGVGSCASSLLPPSSFPLFLSAAVSNFRVGRSFFIQLPTSVPLSRGWNGFWKKAVAPPSTLSPEGRQSLF